ncbi:MAG: putative molybdenum carrier protein [Planctomycetota bacterium]|nr:putative molybdenum carrier protein [Planctomycetota bacterium]MDA1160920.1 putative molybdenum carrier protein [Planctomycetota bacterium]
MISEVETLIDRLISGGQTGVDRAALAVALELGIPCGGWCPRGRRAEDGRIPNRFPLKECTSKNYAVRTRMNVEDSDGTLILSRGKLSGGTALTESIARQLGKPWLVIDLVAEFDAQPVEDWIAENRIRILNVAGPRESQQVGIFDQACEYLRTFIKLTAD